MCLVEIGIRKFGQQGAPVPRAQRLQLVRQRSPVVGSVVGTVERFMRKRSVALQDVQDEEDANEPPTGSSLSV